MTFYNAMKRLSFALCIMVRMTTLVKQGIGYLICRPAAYRYFRRKECLDVRQIVRERIVLLIQHCRRSSRDVSLSESVECGSID